MPSSSTIPDAAPPIAASSHIPNGTVVICPDRLVGEVSGRTREGLAVVVHSDRTLCRGPWYFAYSQLERATPAERASYWYRVEVRCLNDGAPESVLENCRDLSAAAAQEIS